MSSDVLSSAHSVSLDGIHRRDENVLTLDQKTAARYFTLQNADGLDFDFTLFLQTRTVSISASNTCV